jgi:hypothetical protein
MKPEESEFTKVQLSEEHTKAIVNTVWHTNKDVMETCGLVNKSSQIVPFLAAFTHKNKTQDFLSNLSKNQWDYTAKPENTGEEFVRDFEEIVPNVKNEHFEAVEYIKSKGLRVDDVANLSKKLGIKPTLLCEGDNYDSAKMDTATAKKCHYRNFHEDKKTSRATKAPRPKLRQNPPEPRRLSPGFH